MVSSAIESGICFQSSPPFLRAGLQFGAQLTLYSLFVIFNPQGCQISAVASAPLPTPKLEVQADTRLWRKNKVTRDFFDRGSDSFGIGLHK